MENSTPSDLNIGEGIAIIGLSGRFPGADSVEEFWENLLNGRDCITKVPGDRHPYFQGDSTVDGGYLKCKVDEFDGNFFNLSPRDCGFVDPQQRLFLEASWESLENAGIPPSSLRGTSTGVFLGMSGKEYEAILRGESSQPKDFLREMHGNAWSGASGRLSHFLDLRGPCIGVEATCASATVAIHLACLSLKDGETDLCLAAGVNLILEQPQRFPPTLLSSRCKTFDTDADGFVTAEGVGVFVLKRYKDALLAGNRILGVIRGSAVGHDGSTRSFGTPNPDAQAKIMNRAFEKAGIKPLDINYVEVHGTGTPVGDLKEMKSLEKVFLDSGSSRASSLIIGATKPNIGHSLAASGALSLVKLLCCLKHKRVPLVRLANLRPEIATILEKIGGLIPSETTLLERTPDRRILASMNSFGITGTAAVLVIEEPPSPSFNAETRNFHQLLNISARTPAALVQLCEAYKKYALGIPDSHFPRFVHSVNCERDHFPHRVSVLASTRENFMAKLESEDYSTGIVPESSPKQDLVFLFTGNGAQYFGMGRKLYDTSDAFRKVLDKCDETFTATFRQSLKTYLWSDEFFFKNNPHLSQPATFCFQHALYCFWRYGLGVHPDVVLGHSFGEFAAAVAAGIYSFDEVFALVCKRTELIQSLGEGGMLAVVESRETVSKLLLEFEESVPDFYLDVAAINSKMETVVSGPKEFLMDFSKICKDRGIGSRVVKVGHAYHSRGMEPIVAGLEVAASKLRSRPLNCKYISSSTGSEMKPEDFTAEYWGKHLRGPVEFSKAAQGVLSSGLKTYVEIGPQPTLCNLVSANAESDTDLALCPSLRRSEPNDWKTILASLGKLYVSWNGTIDWSRITRTGQVAMGMPLPNYPFQRTKCWMESSLRNPLTRLPLCESLHPLLGARCDLPVSGSTWFYNAISSESYLADHMVNGEVLLPGACYLETIFAFGVHHLKTEIKNLVIEDLEFHNPMSLTPQTLKYQTCGEKVDANYFNVEIYSQRETDWVKNSSGRLRVISNEVETTEQEELIACSKSDGTTINCSGIYDSFQTCGIELSQSFQSLGKGECFENGDMVFSVSELKEADEQYIVHPILLDAMIQAVLYSKISEISSSSGSLTVPRGVKEIVLFRKPSNTGLLTIHVSSQHKTVRLCQNGHVVVKMKGCTFATIAGKLKGPPPRKVPIYEEKWVQVSEKRIQIPSLSLDAVDEWPKLKPATSLLKIRDSDERIKFLAYLYILKLFYSFGWKPNVGQTISPKMLKDYIPVGPKHFEKTLHEFLLILQNEGILGLMNVESISLASTWTVVRMPPSLPTVLSLIQSSPNEFDRNRIEYKFLAQCGERLEDVFLGTQDPISLIFSNPSSNASIFYQSSEKLNSDASTLVTMFEQCLEQCNWQGGDSPTLKILEIGAGTGATTRRVLEKLELKSSISYEYTFTDVGLAFLANARENFKSYGRKMLFQILDIEKDPFSQGFVPGQFDVVIASNVFHATRDLRDTLRHVNYLLCKDGYLLFNELVEKYRLCDLSFGLLDGWWRFTDFRQDQLHPLISRSVWKELLTESGFQNIGSPPSSGCLLASKQNTLVSTTKRRFWIVYNHGSDKITASIMTELTQLGRQALLFSSGPPKFEETALQDQDVEGAIFLANIEETRDTSQAPDLMDVTSKFIDLLKKSASGIFGQRLILVTRGVGAVTSEGYVNCASSTLLGILKSFRNEHSNIQSTCLDLDPSPEICVGSEARILVNQLWNVEPSHIMAFRKGNAWTSRLAIAAPLHVQIQNQGPGDDIFKIEDETQLDNNAAGNEPYQIVVTTEAVGLNFRDVLLASNLLSSVEQSYGLEYSGVVSFSKSDRFKVGDRVFGVCAGGAMTSKIRVEDETLLMKMSDHMSFNEASTIPIVFITAYHSLVNVAKVKPHDRVLIHTGSGGLGLAAIQVAKWLGAEIYATAGTQKKRNFLRESLQLSHVYDSRTASTFLAGILRDTDGNGVDVILNTLTGSGFVEASMQCLNKCKGKFVELSKLNIWSHQQVKEISPNVTYVVVDVLSMIQKADLDLRNTMVQLEGLFESRILHSLPHVQYNISSLQEAFKYFQSCQHIGKIVINFHANVLFNPAATYIVTGGLGGIGLKVCEWILQNGGQHVTLFARSAPSAAQRRALAGSNVEIVSGDVSSYEDCARLFTISSRPIRGIFHCAGVLADGTITRQSWTPFEHVYKAKVTGSWNLHHLSLGIPLEYFVLFSSIASIIGTPGQSNHSAANSYMDTLAHFRARHLGLKGLSLNWGLWGEIGAAANLSGGIYRKVHHFSPAEGINGLQEALGMGQAQLVISRMDDDLGTTILPSLKQYLSGLGTAGRAASTEQRSLSLTKEIQGREIKDVITSGKSDEDVVSQIESFIEASIRYYSGDERSSYDPHSPLSSLGVDSLMGMELRSKLSRGLEIPITPKAFQENDSIRSLGKYILQLVHSNKFDNDKER